MDQCSLTGLSHDQRQIAGIVREEQIMSGALQDVLNAAFPVIAAGRAPRRAPVFVDSRAVPDEARTRLQTALSQQNVVHGPKHLFSFMGALLVGQGSVVVPSHGQHYLLFDSVREFLAHKRVPDGFERSEAECLAMARPITRRIEQNCLLLKRPWANNFGHWLVDQAMALSYIVHLEALPALNLVIGKVHSAKLRNVMFETIAAIAPQAVIHEHPDDEVWEFRQLNYLTPLHVPPLFKLPAALACLRADILALSAAEPEESLPRRIHIVRQGNVRRLVNEAEIMECSARHGFVPVRPETMSLAQQAKLFNQAEAIIGIKGAAMTNILFARQDCRVMMMSPASFTDTFFWDIASVRGLAYAEIFGETVTDNLSLGHNDFRLDTSRVEEMFRAVLAPG